MKSVPVNEKIGRDDLFSSQNRIAGLLLKWPENKEKFEKTLKGISFANIGTVNDSGKLEVFGLNGKKVVSELINDLKEACSSRCAGKIGGYCLVSLLGGDLIYRKQVL